MLDSGHDPQTTGERDTETCCRARFHVFIVSAAHLPLFPLSRKAEIELPCLEEVIGNVEINVNGGVLFIQRRGS